jgi:Transmembrane secretion effector
MTERQTQGTQPDHGSSAWAPLALPTFRALFFAQLGSNIGVWMQSVGAQWFSSSDAAVR